MAEVWSLASLRAIPGMHSYRGWTLIDAGRSSGAGQFIPLVDLKGGAENGGSLRALEAGEAHTQESARFSRSLCGTASCMSWQVPENDGCREETCKNEPSGAPGWHSRLSLWLLISVRVVISESRDRAQGPVLSMESA